jgi:branched-subunit amino acid transport protein
MTAWLVVLAAGLGSYMFRISMVVLVGRIGSPARFERASALVVPSAFAALAAGGVVASCRAAGGPEAIAPLAAVVVAVAAVGRTGSPHTAIVAGMPALWVLNLVSAG